MADEILENRAAYDLPTWHMKGKYVGEAGFKNSQHVIDTVGFQDYASWPMTYDVNGTTYRYADRFVLARPRFPEEGAGSPYIPVGTCANMYTILQPREAFVPFDPLVANGLASYTAAGMLRNGEIIWIAAKMQTAKVRDLPKSSRVSGDDTVEMYMMLSNGYTGNVGVRMTISHIRTVCMNTLRSAVDSGISVSFIHSKNVHDNLATAADALAEANEQFAVYVDACKAMSATKATKKRVDAIFEAMFPITNETGERHFVSQHKVDKMKELAEAGYGNGGGSLFDVFNGITQYLDYNIERKNEDAMAVLDSSWNGTRGQRRAVAFDAIMKQVA